MDKSLIVWILSPLNVLANQQAKTFLQWGISATAINSTTASSELYRVRKPSHTFVAREINF
jgi:superfamily II DNA helicase RecQ